MLSLDPRTIYFLTGFMGALMSVVLFFLRRSFPPTIKGLTEWTAAPAIIFVSTLLLSARGAIPDFFSMTVASLALLSGMSLLYLGSQRFFGLPQSIRLWSSLVLAAVLVLAWYAHVEPHYGIRVLVASSLIVILSASHARLLLRHGTRSFATSLTAAALLIQAGAQALRFVSALDTPADGTLFALSPAQTAIITTFTFSMLMVTIGVALMATDRLRYEFEHLASHDSLTGALTRRALLEACEQELERCQRKDHVMSMLMLDLDHFKTINDIHGHLTGDRVLIDFVARVTALLRRPDRFGRFGGEEFVALLPETSLEEARNVAERIRADVASAGAQPWCTVSIGAATSSADEASVDTLLARADAALYQAKAAGRNCVKIGA
ncbi:MAG: GGDEF domain-containing protein [Sulfuritalea sp.]|jgi:diguanylate cyclase (GGDEF)-like protein|nr:GGDEF domain-containing protein [Sulfuritalea sp.]